MAISLYYFSSVVDIRVWSYPSRSNRVRQRSSPLEHGTIRYRVLKFVTIWALGGVGGYAPFTRQKKKKRQSPSHIKILGMCWRNTSPLRANANIWTIRNNNHQVLARSFSDVKHLHIYAFWTIYDTTAPDDSKTQTNRIIYISFHCPPAHSELPGEEFVCFFRCECCKFPTRSGVDGMAECKNTFYSEDN